MLKVICKPICMLKMILIISSLYYLAYRYTDNTVKIEHYIYKVNSAYYITYIYTHS